MALDLVTGYQGKNHVTAEQWADFNRGVYGDAAILPIGNRMQVEIQTANQITVKDGTGVFDGRQVYIGYGESENIAIESGTQEMLRNDIVVIEYTKDESTGVESAAFKVIAGTPAASDPADPSYQDMDIRTGVFVSQKPFCRVRLNGVAIEGVDMLVEVKEFAAHAFQPPAANLTTTKPGQALDATMGKELKEGFDQLNSGYGVNENGSYLRLPDGTQICWLNTTVTDQAINTLYTNGVYQGIRNWTFPIPFIDSPSVSCGCFRYGTGASWGAVSASTPTEAGLRAYDFVSREAGQNCIIQAIAIGRWKLVDD